MRKPKLRALVSLRRKRSDTPRHSCTNPNKCLVFTRFLAFFFEMAERPKMATAWIEYGPRTPRCLFWPDLVLSCGDGNPRRGQSDQHPRCSFSVWRRGPAGCIHPRENWQRRKFWQRENICLCRKNVPKPEFSSGTRSEQKCSKPQEKRRPMN